MPFGVCIVTCANSAYDLKTTMLKINRKKERQKIMKELHGFEGKNGVTLMRLQNQKHPDEVVEVNWDHGMGSFVTKGLKQLFDIDEIKIDAGELLGNVEEIAMVLYWLLESMSVANDLNLPFSYEDRFTLGSKTYELQKEGEYRLLKEIH